jgi:hypothetical protein
MLLEGILLVYLLGFLVFFIALLRDKYVELNKVIILAYFMASLFWPLTGLFYLIDDRK